jgi:hypothetical protein
MDILVAPLLGDDIVGTPGTDAVPAVVKLHAEDHALVPVVFFALTRQ